MAIKYEGLTKVMRNPEISVGAKALLFDLLLYAGVDGNCWPGQQLLGLDLGKSDRQIRIYLDELIEHQLVRAKRRFNGSNRYSFSPEIYFLNEDMGIDTERKPASGQLGTVQPIQKGSELPPKKESESTHLSISNLIGLFSTATGRQVNSSDIQHLQRLLSDFPGDWIEQLMSELKQRNKTDFNVGYLRTILNDWRIKGRPEPRPKFTPCGKNGCQKGFIPNEKENVMRYCDCRALFESELDSWKAVRNVA